jgi:predicted TIM-barrel fold metal-dependent hydrolase
MANDGMAALVRKYPDRFPAFIASLAMNNPEEASKEVDRAVKELDARGVQIFSNVNGEPLDQEKFWPIFEKMAAYDLPIWLHPARGEDFPDYKTETKSPFEIWWVLGWPYETSVAMARLVFWRIFEKLPDIKIITHHMGAMIPYFDGRVGPGWDQMGARQANEDYAELKSQLTKRPIDYFKMFYADTALFGSDAGTECGLKFFGPDKCLFASDCPFDPEGGPMYIRETIRVLDKLGVSDGDRKKLYEDNTRRLLKLN